MSRPAGTTSEPLILEKLTATRSYERRVDIWLAACREIQYERPRQALRYAKEALAEARSGRRGDLECHALRMVGICHFAAHDYHDALRVFTEVLRKSKKLGDTTAVLKSYQNIGLTLRRLGQHTEALDMYSRALVLARTIDDLPLLMNVLTNNGATFAFLQRPVEALEAYGEALSISERLSDEGFQAYVAGNIADVYVTIGADASAAEWARRSLEVHRTRNDQYGVAMALNNLGRVHRNMGEFEAAQTYFTECLTVMVALGDAAGQARTHLFLAELSLRRRAFELAIQSAQKAQLLFSDLNDHEYTADALVVLGQVAEAQNRLSEASAFYHQASSILESTQNSAKLADAIVREARVAVALEAEPKALRMLRRALKIAEGSSSIDALADVHALLANVYEANGNLDKALRHREALYERKLTQANQLHANHARSMELRLEVERAERRRILAEQQSFQLEATLDIRSKELAESAIALGQTNDLLVTVERDIRNALAAKSDQASHLKNALARITMHLRTGRDKHVFDERLTFVNREFLRVLEERAPSLNNSERKVAMLLRLDLSSKEISAIMNVDPKSVEVYRTRIRRKLRLQQTDHLVRYLQSLSTM